MNHRPDRARGRNRTAGPALLICSFSFVVVFGCSSQPAGQTPNDAGGPDGAGSSDAIANDPACPASLPSDSGSCPRDQLLCTYPSGPGFEGSWHQTALCQAGASGRTWLVAPHLDRADCVHTTDPGRDIANADCAARVSRACTPLAVAQTPQELLTRQISDIAVACNGPPNESHFELDFQAGCASRVALVVPGPTDTTAFLDCVTNAVSTVRFDCAQALACARLDPTTLP